MSSHTHLASSIRRPCVPIEPEIVDDSEPERIELQKTLKKRHRTSAETLHSPRIITHNNDLHHVDEILVYEISDSDSQLAVSSSKYTKLRDIDDRGQDQVQPTNSYYKLPKPSVSHMQISTALDNPSGEDELSKGSSKLNLDRFVFKNSRTPMNLQVSTGPAPSTGSAIPNSTAKGFKQKRLPLTIDVTKISRCVCCNVQWTARKSGAQKMIHIQSCAKKHAFDSETINLLIQKQSLEEPVLKKTLFENVLVDAAPKEKLKRRKKDGGSLKTVSTSRASILARAQGILSTSVDDFECQNGSSFAGLNQGHSELPSTQAFGRSGLAQMQNFESNTFSLDGPGISDDNSDEGGSEAQPAFLASCLASHPLKVFGDYELDHKGTRSAEPSIGDKSEVETNYTLNPRRLSPSSIEGRGMTSSKIPRTHTPDSSQELPILTNLTIHSLAPTMKSKKIRKAVTKLKVSSHSDEPTLLSDSVTPKKKKGPTKKTPSKVTYEEWQSHLMRNIMLDTDLHLRILRYEPIHFNVFLEIAMRSAPTISKLNQHLRRFLDDQAIIFYVKELGRSRR